MRMAAQIGWNVNCLVWFFLIFRTACLVTSPVWHNQLWSCHWSVCLDVVVSSPPSSSSVMGIWVPPKPCSGSQTHCWWCTPLLLLYFMTIQRQKPVVDLWHQRRHLRADRRVFTGPKNKLFVIHYNREQLSMLYLCFIHYILSIEQFISRYICIWCKLLVLLYISFSA